MVAGHVVTLSIYLSSELHASLYSLRRQYSDARRRERCPVGIIGGRIIDSACNISQFDSRPTRCCVVALHSLCLTFLEGPMSDQQAIGSNKPLPSLAGAAAASQPVTIWTRIADRFRFGKLLLVGAGLVGVFAVMFIVLGTLEVFKNRNYRAFLPGASVGQSEYPGDSWGTVSEGHFDLSGKGDGTYYGKWVRLYSPCPPPPP